MLTVRKQLASGVTRTLIAIATSVSRALVDLANARTQSLPVLGLRHGLRQIVHHLRLIPRDLIVRGA